MKRTLALIIAVCMILVGVTACGGNTAAPAAPASSAAAPTAPAASTEAPAAEGDLEAALAGMKDVSLNWAISMGPSHRANETFQYFADEVNKRTNGKVTINLFPGDTLVTSNSIYDSMVQGIVDMGEADPAYSVAAFPMMSCYFLPGMNFANSRVATYVVNDLFTESGLPELSKAHYLFAYGMSPSILFGNKKVEKLEDFAGMQIRATGFAISVVEGLGAAAVGITPAETYEALMKGTADAALMPAEALLNWNFAEVCKYACKVTGFSTSCHYIAINNEVWNSLPAPVQQVFEEVADECVEKIAPLWDTMGEEGYKFAEEKNTEVYEMSAEELARCTEQLKGVREKWAADNASKGDTAAVLEYIDGLIEKYNAEYGA